MAPGMRLYLELGLVWAANKAQVRDGVGRKSDRVVEKLDPWPQSLVQLVSQRSCFGMHYYILLFEYKFVY